MKRLTALFFLMSAFALLTSCTVATRSAPLFDGVVCGVEGYDEAPPIAEEDLSQGALSVGTTDVRVLAILGEPLQKSFKKDPASPGDEEGAFLYRETWTYPGISVTFLNVGNATIRPSDIGRVWAIAVTSAGYATPRGLQVGDPLRKVLKAYGTTCTVRKESGARIIEYGEFLCITVTVRNGIVESISTERLYE